MKVLVVDDDATSVLLATTLVRKLGHDSDTATNSEEAWAKLGATEYDVLVTDLVMPAAGNRDPRRRTGRTCGLDRPSRPSTLRGAC